jgi:hypothetical protein
MSSVVTAVASNLAQSAKRGTTSTTTTVATAPTAVSCATFIGHDASPNFLLERKTGRAEEGVRTGGAGSDSPCRFAGGASAMRVAAGWPTHANSEPHSTLVPVTAWSEHKPPHSGYTLAPPCLGGNHVYLVNFSGSTLNLLRGNSPSKSLYNTEKH